MSDNLSKPSTAFEERRKLLSGPLVEVALAVKTAIDKGSSKTFLVFDDATGRVIDLDLRGSKAEIVERLSRPFRQFKGRFASHPSKASEPVEGEASEPRGRGRPKLGVVAREVTLLPRHWEWLAAQPGGASATLRRLVEEARRMGGSRQQRRAAQEAAYRFMLAIAGDLPGYEEGLRALFADDRAKLEECIAAWPEEIRAYAIRLAFGPSDQSAKRRIKKKGAAMTVLEPIRYLKPSQRTGRDLVQRGIKGSVFMLNLLRFRDVADYTANPELAPAAPISGAEAFNRYIGHTLPLLRESGGELMFAGAGGAFLVGPEHERWDLVMLVRQSSVQSFLAFASHREYLAGLGHRTAAIEDSRLLPMTELTIPA